MSLSPPCTPQVWKIPAPIEGLCQEVRCQGNIARANFLRACEWRTAAAQLRCTVVPFPRALLRRCARMLERLGCVSVRQGYRVNARAWCGWSSVGDREAVGDRVAVGDSVMLGIGMLAIGNSPTRLPATACGPAGAVRALGGPMRT